MTITVVLDTTALIAYTKGSVAVGELLSIITDDGDSALIPATCLAEAHLRLGVQEEALLAVLSSIPCVEHSPLAVDQAAEVGALARKGGGIAAAHAAVEAVAADAQVVTQDAPGMGGLLPPDWPVVEV